MNRRNFLRMALGAAAGAVAAQYGLLEMEEVNRVYSFPSQIRLANSFDLAYVQTDMAMRFEPKFYSQSFVIAPPVPEWVFAVVREMEREVDRNSAAMLESFRVRKPKPFHGGAKMQQPLIYSS